MLFVLIGLCGWGAEYTIMIGKTGDVWEILPFGQNDFVAIVFFMDSSLVALNDWFYYFFIDNLG